MTSEDFVTRVQEMSPHVRDVAGMVKSFEREIASKRRSSLIESFEELVAILVRRLFVDPEDEGTWVHLNNACMKYAGRPFHSPNSVGHGIQSPPSQQVSPLCHNVTEASCLLDPDGLIVYFLSERIHASWRNFARGLKVREANINEIENRCGRDHKACVKAVLDDYQRNLSWASPSNGDVIKDIYSSLKLLQKDYLLEEFERLKKKYPGK